MTADELYNLGIKDCKLTYKNYKDASNATLFTSMFLTTFVAVGTSATPPSKDRYTYPNVILSKNPHYVRGFDYQAWKTKRTYVWTNFTSGTIISLFAYMIYASSGSTR
ncbi:MAG: hypothetical protein NW207_05470 [Cytophagales bacterium]|nr:hypothetical protein [Cytophagales bacterium]